MDPDKTLEEIRELVRNHEGERGADALAERVGKLDEWLVGGGLFPAVWEDTHGWVRVRRDLADKQRQLSSVEEMLRAAQRAVDQLEARAQSAREQLEGLTRAAPMMGAITTPVLDALNGSTQ
jgi:biopolymer transport protein ExbB/TolQ